MNTEAVTLTASAISARSKSDGILFGSFVFDGDVLGLLAPRLIVFDSILAGDHVLEGIF